VSTAYATTLELVEEKRDLINAMTEMLLEREVCTGGGGANVQPLYCLYVACHVYKPPPSPLPPPHTHTHIHKRHMHACMHAHTHTHTLAHTCARTHTLTQDRHKRVCPYMLIQVIGLEELEGLLGQRPFAATGELRNIDR